ncbi:hypothetical protein CPB85DRAFT_672135 [Mucidula mucida]|nr:hypothetical protein CPB85DRAFT_672135 [Mucidula mucida]
MTLIGVEDNSEFLFELPRLLRQTNDVSLVGYPVDATIASLSIQLSVIAASVVFSLYYATLQMAIPLQVDMWIAFTDDLRISAYDMNPRRFSEALSYVQPKLVPLIVQEMHLTDINQGNVTDVVAKKAATDMCRISDEHCSGVNRQYESFVDTNASVLSPWINRICSSTIQRFYHFYTV